MLYKIALAILSSLESSLLQLETVEIFEALKDIKSKIDSEATIEFALKIKISKDKIQNLEKAYSHRIIGRMSVQSVPPSRPKAEDSSNDETRIKLPPVKNEPYSPQPRSFVVEEIREDSRDHIITKRRSTFTGLSEDPLRRSTQVPTLPDIYNTRKYTNSFRGEPDKGWYGEASESASEEADETLDAQTVLHELLHEKSKDNIFKINYQKIPTRKASDIDGKINFIKRLPI